MNIKRYLIQFYSLKKLLEFLVGFSIIGTYFNAVSTPHLLSFYILHAAKVSGILSIVTMPTKKSMIIFGRKKKERKDIVSEKVNNCVKSS